MNNKKVNITPELIKERTEKSQYLSENELKVRIIQKKTPDSELRRYANQLCSACFYHPGMLVLQAFWNQPCGYCEKDMVFSNSGTDDLCIDCAKKHSLCKKCCAEID